MTTAGDSVLVTPGSGATIASHTVSSKEHEVFMVADAPGNLVNDNLGVWCTTTLDTLDASTTEECVLSLLNADAALVVDVLAVYWVVTQTGAAGPIGASGLWSRLHRTTAHSAGTLGTPVKVDSTSSALDADITVRHTNPTPTVSGEALAAVGASATSSDYSAAIGGSHLLWSIKNEGVPIVLRQNEGIAILVDAATADTLAFHSAGIIFRVR